VVGSDPIPKSSVGVDSLCRRWEQKRSRIGGTFQRTRVRIPELYMGKQTMGAQMAILVDDGKMKRCFDGVLGMRGPRFRRLRSTERRRFSWEPPSMAPAITVAIYDDVGLSRKIDQAQDEAIRVYQKAGVAIFWIVCKSSSMEADSSCQDPPSGYAS